MANRGAAEGWHGFAGESSRAESARPVSGFQNSSYSRSNAYENTNRGVGAQPLRITPQASAPRYVAQNSPAQHFSEPKYSQPKYSAPKYSAPKFSAPKAPKAQHFSAPKNSGGGHSSKSSHKH
jgi:hypothetical protein